MRAQLLREMVTEAFDFVVKGPLDLESATYAQLEEVFHNTFRMTDDVSRS